MYNKKCLICNARISTLNTQINFKYQIISADGSRIAPEVN